MLGSVVRIEETAASRLARLNCAGHGCDERVGCRRYEARVPSGRVESPSGYEAEHYTWGSFDVERLLLGSCASFVRIARAM